MVLGCREQPREDLLDITLVTLEQTFKRSQRTYRQTETGVASGMGSSDNVT